MLILYICILVLLIYIMAQLSFFFSGSMRSDAIFKTGQIKHYKRINPLPQTSPQSVQKIEQTV